MRNLLFGLIFGLLAIVHSAPVANVTQMPAKADDEILLEAVTDGFLIDLPALTTESPKRNTTTPASQHLSTVTGESSFEGSAVGETSDLFHQHEGEQHATTTLSVTHTQSSTSSVFLRAVDHSSFNLYDIQSTLPSFTPTSVPKETQSSTTTDRTTTSQTTNHAGPSFDPLSSDSGSGDEQIIDQYPATTPSMTPTTSPVTKTSTTNSATISETTTTTAAPYKPKAPRMFAGTDQSESELGSGEDSRILDFTSESELPKSVDVVDNEKVIINNEPQKGHTEHHQGSRTPGWIIIVAFIVGIAALVVICIAIATRDKWNGPKQATQLENNTNSANQLKEQEMETFIRTDQPKENGKATEYTVIPLDELPEKYSSD
ncbi:A-agglutinin anchorage subunit-like [Notolabrus celidotus]|uniref:A-agglutinin anchorage subunit-like n=1 Tax=Notolabrus celidotus TaxID=1203425 RepID=UPI0014900157|nr:A-agglutinin anchorage subunit-like [Notolabrus celidotus]